MNLIRKILYTILGKNLYFRLVSRCFLLLYHWGFLKRAKKFNTHYFVKNLINTDDCVIDIGANLGYYTTIFSKSVGANGLVYAVEPIPHYRKILSSNTKRLKNIKIIPFALSNTEGKSKMGIPGKQKYRHGLMKILDKSTADKSNTSFFIETKIPKNLFANIERLDYIKCDIEGHEAKVIPEFRQLIEKFNPIIQIEIEKANFEMIDSLISSLGYKRYIVSDNKLISHKKDKSYNSDLLYIPDYRVIKLTQNNLILKIN